MSQNQHLIQSFLNNNDENGDYNQYWYSSRTIDNMAQGTHYSSPTKLSLSHTHMYILNYNNSIDITEQINNAGINEFRVAFLSTPSIYFSLPEAIRGNCYVFDFDKKWDNDRGFVFYDFNEPTNVPSELIGTFDMMVVDPPFIVREVWEKYATTCKLLLKKGTKGRLLLTTVNENLSMLQDILGEDVYATNFLPSIPNLVYQYNLYVNYQSNVFSKKNPEIPE